MVEIIDDNWLDDELFSVSGLKITAETAIIGSSLVIVLIVAGVIICLSISYYKRKAIKEGAV